MIRHVRPVVCQAWWELCLARSSSAEAFCLPQPVLPPHHCSSRRMQFFSQACPDFHSYDHSLTHFSQNEPPYFKQFKVRFHGSFRWSKSWLLPLPPLVPSSMFPSPFLCWLLAASHTGHCQRGCFWLYRWGYNKQLRESVSQSSTFVRRAVTNRGNAVLSVCAVSGTSEDSLFAVFFSVAICTYYPSLYRLLCLFL